jgi:ribosome-binding factor A
MPKDYPRTRRIAEQIQREIAELIRTELKDPRIPAFITITDVEVTKDQEHAKIFFTTLAETADVKETTAALKRAAGFLRTQLAHRMKLRTVPQLDFKYDASVERGMKLSRLIDEAVASDSKPQPPSGDE